MAQTTYFRSSQVIVTNDVFVWRVDGTTRMFRVKELTAVGVIRGETDASRVTAMHVTSAAALGAAVAWPAFNSTAAVGAAAVVIAVPGFVAIAVRRLRPRTYQLRAQYAGRAVMLYATTDATTFGQVSRALRRAIEANDPPVRYELAGG